MPSAIAKAAREFWKGLNTKQRNDVRRDGLKIEVREIYLDTSSDV